MDSGIDSAKLQPGLDHIVYATPDLEGSARDVAAALGVAPSFGGSHIGRGTRNSLLSLGNGSYLELIGLDPAQENLAGEIPFGLDRLTAPKIVAWALRVHDIEQFVERVKAAGYEPGPVAGMGRITPDGTQIQWRLTRSLGDDVPALIPFLIDWEDSLHPSETAAAGARLGDFHVETADPTGVKHVLAILGAEVRVEVAPMSRLAARLSGPKGELDIC
ncbi:MAG TPA: VOC family protein [Chloroflexota bacterium]|jgi:hypothetical protein|nr:VOC family protein [Chloroflexota bacterium]